MYMYIGMLADYFPEVEIRQMHSSIGIDILGWLDVHVSRWKYVHDRTFEWMFRMDPEYDGYIVGLTYALIRWKVLTKLINFNSPLSLSPSLSPRSLLLPLATSLHPLPPPQSSASYIIIIH